jgi:pyroglutamyl-peptidase
MDLNPIVLVTGFEPFGRWRINSSWEAARLLPKRLGSRVVVVRLPVHRQRAAAMLKALLERHRPEACLLTGLARGPKLRIERVARRPRALAGPGAPGRFAGSWPVTEQGLALRQSGLPYRISINAGRYVCDSTYWALLNFRINKGWPVSVGFLHVPPLSRRFTAKALAAGMERIIRRRLVRSSLSGTGR